MCLAVVKNLFDKKISYNLHFFDFHRRILKQLGTRMKLPQNDQGLQHTVSECNCKNVKGKKENTLGMPFQLQCLSIMNENLDSKKHLEK